MIRPAAQPTRTERGFTLGHLLDRRRNLRLLAVVLGPVLLVAVFAMLLTGAFSAHGSEVDDWDRRLVRVVSTMGPTAVGVAPLSETSTEATGVPVHLVGLDCPVDWSNDAQRYLAELAVGRTGMLVMPQGDDLGPPRRPGAYLRSAYLFLDDGPFVNEKMIADGYARVSPDTPARIRAWLKRLAEFAKNRGTGLWPKPEWEESPES